MAGKKKNKQDEKPMEELSYAERLRRQEDDDRYMAEQRMNNEQKTGCLGMSASFLVGAFCLVFLVAGLGFAGYGVSNIFDGGKVKDIVVQIVVGLLVSAASVGVWFFFKKNLNNDK